MFWKIWGEVNWRTSSSGRSARAFALVGHQRQSPWTCNQLFDFGDKAQIKCKFLGLEGDKEQRINQITYYSKALPLSIMTYWLDWCHYHHRSWDHTFRSSFPHFYCILHCISIFNKLGSLGPNLIWCLDHLLFSQASRLASLHVHKAKHPGT